MFGLYRTLTSLGGPLISWHLARRAGRGKEDPLRKAERKGISDKLRPDGKLVWNWVIASDDPEFLPEVLEATRYPESYSLTAVCVP